MTSGMIFDIKRYAINDGPGIRTAVFFKGCPLSCIWCHNPESQISQIQLMFRSNRCKSSRACIEACQNDAISWQEGPLLDWKACNACGECAAVCYAGAFEMVGRETTTDRLMAEIERDIPFYDQSGGGVTLTGGEPLLQVDFLKEILQACKDKGIHTIVDTSGHASAEAFEIILPLVDIFLYDLKLMDDSRHRQYTSVSNRLILENLLRLSESGAHIIIRIPLIPGLNDDEENMEKTAQFLTSLPSLDSVELMPYHDIGVAKYNALGMNYRLADTKPATGNMIDRAEQILSDAGLPVHLYSGRKQ